MPVTGTVNPSKLHSGGYDLTVPRHYPVTTPEVSPTSIIADNGICAVCH